MHVNMFYFIEENLGSLYIFKTVVLRWAQCFNPNMWEKDNLREMGRANIGFPTEKTKQNKKLWRHPRKPVLFWLNQADKKKIMYLITQRMR